MSNSENEKIIQELERLRVFKYHTLKAWEQSTTDEGLVDDLAVRFQKMGVSLPLKKS